MLLIMCWISFKYVPLSLFPNVDDNKSLNNWTFIWLISKLLKEDIEIFISEYSVGNLDSFEEIVDGIENSKLERLIAEQERLGGVNLLAEKEAKDKVFDAVYELCELHGHQSGLIFMTPEILRSA